jgi:hypothetical protein
MKNHILGNLQNRVFYAHITITPILQHSSQIIFQRAGVKFDRLEKKILRQFKRKSVVHVEYTNEKTEHSEQRSTMDEVIDCFEKSYQWMRSITPEYFLEANEIDYECVFQSDDEEQQPFIIGVILVGGLFVAGVSYGG